MVERFSLEWKTVEVMDGDSNEGKDKFTWVGSCEKSVNEND